LNGRMRKAVDYLVLSRCGLPVPKFDVFDDSCLTDSEQLSRLGKIVADIKFSGSGQIGLRTEPKGNRSLIHNYPHYMPLRSMEDVLKAMRMTMENAPGVHWWFLVNEAFTSYRWNAVVRVTDQLLLPGGLRLDGEVNLIDNIPLRPAMANTMNLAPAKGWYGEWPSTLREMIISSGLINIWLEISLVSSNGTDRLIFWGMRPNVSEKLERICSEIDSTTCKGASF
jgi:hypothetical protein